MAELPTGTVTMLFSDIEGSTQLLSRLGPDYGDALTAQRKVLRASWSAHAGIEMGTEGDSFFVVFATAPAAVAAAVRGQRDLADHAWPGGERVRVRMGIHTGNPTVHDGGYVGMDVHRAARIAGAAHGGQVVISSSTAELVGGSLPGGVRLGDLGSHHLKDLPQPQHLFQVEVLGLQAEFPPLKTLGASSSLPMPPSDLVGRGAELEELTQLLQSQGVRLLTLTGPGGSGKTRLALGVAQQLVGAFPDGVFFVPLASVSSSDVMWTTVAEAIDAPPESRNPPQLFTYLTHRSVLMVLDNLEQVTRADRVVAELLGNAPKVTVLATSRIPLHLPFEQEHPVPPLELPDGAGLEAAACSGAVQLFVQQARRVKPSFALTAENAADVVAVCRRLDGLPLALELSAARVKLLSPQALLRRLDTALDIASSDREGPSRQRTLRDTIAWSYDLLDPTLAAFFRRLGVFAQGADLEAISAVAGDGDDLIEADAFDMIADLVNASLVSVNETPQGEPRFSMLETVRAYALDQLRTEGEADDVSLRHFRHYLRVALELGPLLDGDRHVEARALLEADLDNFREALGSALALAAPGEPEAGIRMGSRLCLALGGFWLVKGYVAELQRSLERLIRLSGGRDDPEMAKCLAYLATTLRMSGDRDRAHEAAADSVAMWRRLGAPGGLAIPLNELAYSEMDRGEPEVARALFAEAVASARQSGTKVDLLRVLGNSALLEHYEHNYERSLELHVEVLALAEELGSPDFVLSAKHNLACTLRGLGRLEEAKAQMRALIPRALELSEPELLVVIAEDYAAVLAELGEAEAAIRLLGAADATRERLATPRSGVQHADVDGSMTTTKTLPPALWKEMYLAGSSMEIADALAETIAPEPDI